LKKDNKTFFNSIIFTTFAMRKPGSEPPEKIKDMILQTQFTHNIKPDRSAAFSRVHPVGFFVVGSLYFRL